MIVQVSDVWKKYPGIWALQGVSFTVETGKVLGVLGENGAGKSTLFRIIASITRPTKGTVTVMDKPVGLETRKLVAFLPEINPFYEWMKIMEQMEFLAAFYPGWDLDKSQPTGQCQDRDALKGSAGKAQNGVRIFLACETGAHGRAPRRHRPLRP